MSEPSPPADAPALMLLGYWRSGTSYRVRLGLALKRLDYAQQPVDLRAGAHGEPAYLAHNPQGLVPTLLTPQGPLAQSGAILEWLEETYPDPPLLPAGAHDRAVVRAMAATIACDIHPLNNLRVLRALKDRFAVGDSGRQDWIAHWIRAGFAALEAMIAAHGGRFAFGDRPTIADCHLVPQVYSAVRFGVDISDFPRICACDAAMQALPQVAASHPERQPDAD